MLSEMFQRWKWRYVRAMVIKLYGLPFTFYSLLTRRSSEYHSTMFIVKPKQIGTYQGWARRRGCLVLNDEVKCFLDIQKYFLFSKVLCDLKQTVQIFFYHDLDYTSTDGLQSFKSFCTICLFNNRAHRLFDWVKLFSELDSGLKTMKKVKTVLLCCDSLRTLLIITLCA